MNRSEILSAGFYTQYLHNMLGQLSERANFSLQEVTGALSTFHLTQIRRPQQPCRAEDRISSLIVAVYTDLLSRGLPTLPSLMVERTLLKPCMDQGLAHDATNSGIGNIMFEMPDGGRRVPDRWLEMLIRAHVAIDPRMTPISMDAACFGSIEEHEFFRYTLAEVVGNGPLQLFELQSAFSNLLPSALALAHFDQKVDFAVSAPGWNLVVEVDGGQHRELAHTAGDDQRDAALRANNWSVVRIGTDQLYSQATKNSIQRVVPDNNFVRYANLNYRNPLWLDLLGRLALQVVLAPFAIARIQRTLLKALESGLLSLSQAQWKLVVVEQDVRSGVLAVVDLLEHLRAFFELHRVDRQLPAVDLLVYHSPEFRADDDSITFEKLRECNIRVRHEELTAKNTSPSYESVDVLVDVGVLQRAGYNSMSREFVDRHLSASGAAYEIRSAYHPADTRRISHFDPIVYPLQPVNTRTDDGRQRQDVDGRARKTLTFFLGNIFRKLEFRDGQLPIIGRALSLQPVIGLLPTGAGKSLCYQMAALLQPGMTIVIDPIISLMVDQVDNLRNGASVDWIGEINSLRDGAEKKEITNAMADGKIKILFISPERLQSREFRQKLREFSIAFPVSYGVIDEAHCVSEWGHDFRTAYLRVAKTLKEHCRRIHSEPTIIALTGTASFAVLSDVQRELEVDDERAQVFPDSFDRKELHYRVVETPSKQKQQQLFDLLFNHLPAEFEVPRPDLYECWFFRNPCGIAAKRLDVDWVAMRRKGGRNGNPDTSDNPNTARYSERESAAHRGPPRRQAADLGGEPS